MQLMPLMQEVDGLVGYDIQSWLSDNYGAQVLYCVHAACIAYSLYMTHTAWRSQLGGGQLEQMSELVGCCKPSACDSDVSPCNLLTATDPWKGG